MKTVLPFKKRNDRQETALFYHSKSVQITQEVRPVPAHWNASQTVDGVESPLVEMLFFVLRFPKTWRSRIAHDAFRYVDVKVWNQRGNEWELLVPTNAYNGSLFESLARSGFFRYTEKLSPLPDEGLYLPHYQTPVRLWHKVSNVAGVFLSIPQVSWMEYQEQKKRNEPGTSNLTAKDERYEEI